MLQSTPTRDLWKSDHDNCDVLTDMPGSGRAMLDDAIAKARDSEVNLNVDLEGLIFNPFRAPKVSGEFSSCDLCVFCFLCFSFVRAS